MAQFKEATPRLQLLRRWCASWILSNLVFTSLTNVPKNHAKITGKFLILSPAQQKPNWYKMPYGGDKSSWGENGFKTSLLHLKMTSYITSKCKHISESSINAYWVEFSYILWMTLLNIFSNLFLFQVHSYQGKYNFSIPR